MGLLYALISMTFAGLNDFVFKQYIHKNQASLGPFVAGIGLIWALVFGAIMLVTTGGPTWRAWQVSLSVGLALVVANILLIHGLRSVQAGTGAVIYRLNFVAAAAAGIIILNEDLTLWKVFGIGLGLTAILLIGNNTNTARDPSRRAFILGIIALVAASLLRAASGVLYKVANTRGIPRPEVMTICGICWLIGGLAYMVLTSERLATPVRTLKFSFLSGLLVCGIAFFLLLATSVGDVSVVVPIAQLSFVSTMILGIAFHKESFNRRRAIAMIAAGGAVFAMACS